MSSFELGEAVMLPSRTTSEHVPEEPSRAVFAAWQNCSIDQYAPAENRATQLQLLHDITDNACAGQRSEHVRTELVQGSAALEYVWFGNDHTPLPESLRRFSLPDNDSPFLALNPYMFGGRGLRGVMGLLRNAGLDRLLEYRQDLYQKQSKFIFEPLATSLIANTPGYRLLESFNTSRHEWGERPLTAIERLIEEQAAEQAVRRRYGLDDHDLLRLHPNALKEYGRATFRLDEATRFDRRTLPEKPPMERALDFFSQLIIDDAAVEGQVLEDVRVVSGHYPSGYPFRLLRITTDEGSFQTDGETVVNFAEAQGFLTTPDTSRARSVSARIVSDMVLRLFDEARGTDDYAEILEELRTHYTDELIDDLSQLAAGDLSDQPFNQLVTLLVAPTEADEVVDNYFVKVPLSTDIPLSNRLIPRKEFKEARRGTVGHVRKRPFEDQDMRIMGYVLVDEALAGIDGSADMVLHLPDLPDARMPRVYGYEVVGHDAEEQLFGLQYTPEADPYAECPTLIPNESRSELARAYADIGLHELAMLVHGSPDLTVGQLTRLVSKTNRYPLPTDSITIEIPSSLAGYADQARKGRLDLQCVGSSHFLRLSLQTIFGSSAVGTISGDVIRATSTRITTLGHQQTTFIEPGTGRLYILDSTPTGRSITLWRQLLSDQLGAIRRELGKGIVKEVRLERTAPTMPNSHSVVPGAPETIEPSEGSIATYRSSLLQQTKDALILQLRVLLGHDGQLLSRDRLLDEVLRRGNDDVVFRSLSAVFVAAQDQLSKEEADRLVRYIEVLRDCSDPSILRQVDPNDYASSPHLMSVLHTHMSQLARLVQ